MVNEVIVVGVGGDLASGTIRKLYRSGFRPIHVHSLNEIEKYRNSKCLKLI